MPESPQKGPQDRTLCADTPRVVEMFASYDPDDPLLQLIETGMVYFSYPGYI